MSQAELLRARIRTLRHQLVDAEKQLAEHSVEPSSPSSGDRKLADMILAHELEKNWASWGSYLSELTK